MSFQIRCIKDGNLEIVVENITSITILGREKQINTKGANVCVNIFYFELGDKKFIIDTGVGSKYDSNLFGKYKIEFPRKLEKGLAELGLKPEDIDYVLLTHLHFDHSGGNTLVNENGKIVPTFKNATYVIQKKELDYAYEKASDVGPYLLENFVCIKENNQLMVVDGDAEIFDCIEGKVELILTGGHTPGHQVVFLHTNGDSYLFPGDIIPTTSNLNNGLLGGIDHDSRQSDEIRNSFLYESYIRKSKILFYHSPVVWCAELKKNKRGKFLAVKCNPTDRSNKPNMAKNKDSRYMARGASASKSEVHGAIKNVDKGLYPGAFCKITPDLFTNDENYCMIMHADGAGTKSSLAYIYYKETGDTSVFAGIAQDSLIMNADDLIAVGAVDNFVYSNTIGRNKALISGEIIKEIIEGYSKAENMLRDNGVNITSCGGETADVGDLVRTVIVDSTMTVRMKREDVIDADNIKEGDVIVGLASFGKASYEAEYNSGIGSNGLTSARHDMFANLYAEKYPESYSPETPKELVYCGKYELTDDFGEGLTVGKALLSPTRTYAPVVKAVLDKLKGKISGIIHNSGGGQVKCRNFGSGVHYIKDNLFDMPKIFKMLKDSTGVSEGEMYQVFNMGSRMDIILPKKYATTVIDIARSFNIAARIVGHVKKTEDGINRVTIINKKGEKFEY